jgi:hypothetical protein
LNNELKISAQVSNIEGCIYISIEEIEKIQYLKLTPEACEYLISFISDVLKKEKAKKEGIDCKNEFSPKDN